MSLNKDLPKLHELTTKVSKHNFIGRVLALDPGETTGWSIFDRTVSRTELIDAGQIKTWPLEDGVKNLSVLFAREPKFIAYESYHIYGWKSDQHKFSEVATLQVIGCIRTLAILKGKPYCSQTAQVGKGFCSDQKLEAWDLWLEGVRHARDSIRHGAYFLLFGPPKGND